MRLFFYTRFYTYPFVEHYRHNMPVSANRFVAFFRYGTFFVLLQTSNKQGMTRETFNQLPRNEQRFQLLTAGNFLEERQTSRHDVMLYALNDFYTEAYFVKNTNRLSFFKTFTGTEQLAPYLNQIDITGLMEQTLH